MKQFLQLVCGALVIGLLCLGISHLLVDMKSKIWQKIYVYNWGEYIDPELIKQFENQTGIEVIYETFDSNEAMEAKIKMVVLTMTLLFQVNIRYKN